MRNSSSTGAPQGGEHVVTPPPTLATAGAPTEVSFTGRVASLGRDRDRWCVVIPRTTAQLLDKRKIFQVTLRPIGSLR